MLALYVRLYWGIDFTDESYMVLNAFGPVLGARPFVDELMVSQSGSLLMTPFGFLFHWINPAHTGVVLFFRHLYFAVAVLTTLLIFRIFRRELSAPASALIAVLPLTFIPACLPVPSYNSLVYFFGTGGQVALLAVGPVGAGLLHALASYSHPAFLASAGTNFLLQPLRRRYVLGGLLLILLCLITVALFGWENIHRSFAISTEPHTFGGVSKWSSVGDELIHYWRRPWWALAWGLLCVGAGLAGRLNWALAFGGFALTQDFIIPTEVAYGLHQRFVCYGLFSAVLIAVDRRGWRETVFRDRVLRFWLPAFVAGWALTYVSSNGLLMAPLAWMVCVIFAFWRMLQSERWWGYAAAVFILLQAQIFTWTHFYREDSWATLDTRITEGPFAGIYTTYQRRNFINQFSEAMTAIGDHRRETIFIYDMFAAGYLLTLLKPGGPAYMSILPQWMPQMRRSLLDHFADPAHRPDVVVEFFAFPFGADNVLMVNPREGDPFHDPFKNYFLRTGEYREVADHGTFRILRRNPLH